MRRATWSAVIVASSGLLGGCLAYPVVPRPLDQGRGKVPRSALEKLSPEAGTTARRVLLALGEPDFVSEDGRVFTYRWLLHSGNVEVLMYPSSTTIPLKSSGKVIATFDAERRLVTLEQPPPPNTASSADDDEDDEWP